MGARDPSLGRGVSEKSQGATPLSKRGGSVRPAYSTGPKAKTDCPASLVFHSQVVRDGKSSGDALGLHLGDLFIHLSANYALDRDMAVLDAAVDLRPGTQGLRA